MRKSIILYTIFVSNLLKSFDLKIKYMFYKSNKIRVDSKGKNRVNKDKIYQLVSGLKVLKKY